jgi:hypothetical protein
MEERQAISQNLRRSGDFMKTWYVLFVLVMILTSAIAEEIKEPLSILIEERLPVGTLHQPGTVCHFRWEFVDANGKEVSSAAIHKKFKNLVFTVLQVVNNRESTFVMQSLKIETREYQWQIPNLPSGTKYRITLDALSTLDSARARGETSVYTRDLATPEPLPTTFEECLRILMDWNGQRGYCARVSHAEALKLAKYACEWIRKSNESYQDYLLTMEKIEKIEAKVLRVYCPVQSASLKIDHWLVGLFEQLDPKKKMYFLKVSLPVDNSHAYKIMVQRDKMQHITYHTHIGKSQCVIQELYTVIRLTLLTSMKSQATVGGKPFTAEWGTKHFVGLYSGKSEVVTVKIQDGTELRILLNPMHSLHLILRKRENTFILYQGKQEHIFIANEVNLLRF